MDELMLRYPIGKTFEKLSEVAVEQRAAWITELAMAPSHLREAIKDLSAEQLDTPYRPGGWAVRQVVHHLAESDMIAYTRFKFALTEDEPMVSVQLEDRWASVPDYRDVPIAEALELHALIHKRWDILLHRLEQKDFHRAYVHPVSGRWTLNNAIGLIAWHGRHHTAQITSLRKRKGW